MGARAQIHIEETGVYLYTHWGADTLLKDVATALDKHQRWDDISYLTRILFDEMIGEDQGSPTGYGITTIPAGDAEYTIHILPGNNIKVVDDTEWIGTFEDFIVEFL